MFSAQIGLRPLAQLCQRVGSSLRAGVDVRKVWKREAERGSLAHRRRLERVSQAIDRGETLNDALSTVDGFFPPLFREMTNIGEKTGRLDEVLLRLAKYYEHLQTLRRAFAVGILWPALQLTIAVLVIGVVIGLLGWIGGGENDILGFGLIGTRGMLIYFSIVAVIGVIGTLLVRGLLQGKFSAALMAPLMHIPGLGPNLRTMALARMTWSMALAIEAGMDARHTLRVALNSTRNRYFTRHIKQVDRSIAENQEIHESLRDTQAFPDDFLDAVEAGETAGRLAESMTALSKQYEDRARAASSALTVVAAVGIWGIVAAFLIFMIFRVFFFYLGIIEQFTV